MARGQSKYDRVMMGADTVAARPDAADWVRRLRQAALLDADGVALDGALKTVSTLDASGVREGSIPE
jgi:indolepyruvate ferredoxin oxidoreductase beta subunit